MPTSVANPRTEAQQAHRGNFGMISSFSSSMKEAHLVGLHGYAQRKKVSTHNLFIQLNKDCFTPDGDIDFPRVIVSRGSVESVKITSASIGYASTGEPQVLVSFDGRAYGGAATDEFFLFVYSPALCAGRLATPVPRSSGSVSVIVPEEWLDKPLHLYAFLRSTPSRTSDTIHLALPM